MGSASLFLYGNFKFALLNLKLIWIKMKLCRKQTQQIGYNFLMYKCERNLFSCQWIQFDVLWFLLRIWSNYEVPLSGLSTVVYPATTTSSTNCFWGDWHTRYYSLSPVVLGYSIWGIVHAQNNGPSTVNLDRGISCNWHGWQSYCLISPDSVQY